MNASNMTKRIVQGVAAVFGLLGLTWICMGLFFLIIGIREGASDLVQILVIAPMFIVLGAILAAVAWQNLRHFGSRAIQNLASLVAVSAFSVMHMLLDPFYEGVTGSDLKVQYIAILLTPILFAYLLYRILSGILMKITKSEWIQQEGCTVIPDSGDLSEKP